MDGSRHVCWRSLGLIAGCGGTRKQLGLPWLLAQRERQHFLFQMCLGKAVQCKAPSRSRVRHKGSCSPHAGGDRG